MGSLVRNTEANRASPQPYQEIEDDMVSSLILLRNMEADRASPQSYLEIAAFYDKQGS